MGDFVASFNYRKRFEEENKAPAIIKVMDGIHQAIIKCPSFTYVEWLEDLLEQHNRSISGLSLSSSGVRPAIFCKGKSIISGYKTYIEDAGKIISLMDEMQNFGARVTMQYCPGGAIFTILTNAEMEEAVFHKIKMFAKGFLKASNITITEER